MGCIPVQGNYGAHVVQGRQNAAGYIGILEPSSHVTKGARLCGEDWIFQQDHAAIHTAYRSKYLFQAITFVF